MTLGVQAHAKPSTKVAAMNDDPAFRSSRRRVIAMAAGLSGMMADGRASSAGDARSDRSSVAPPGRISRASATFAVAAAGTATDHTTILRDYLSAAERRGEGAYVIAAGEYRIRDTLRFRGDLDLEAEGVTIRYAGPMDRPAIVVGSPSETPIGRSFRLPRVVADFPSDWSKPECIGIQLWNLNRCFVHVPQVVGFTVGYQCAASGQAFTSNDVSVGDLASNMVAEDLRVRPGGAINDNNFNGGRRGNYTGDGPGKAAYGTRAWLDGGGAFINNNRWWGPTYELRDTPEGVNRHPVYAPGGMFCYNHFYAARHESGRGAFALLDGETCYQNIFEVGLVSGDHVVQGVEERGAAKNNRYCSLNYQENFPDSWNSGDLSAMVTASGQPGGAHLKSPFFTASPHDGRLRQFDEGDSFRTLTSGVFIGPGACLALQIDTVGCKRFIVRANTPDGAFPRPRFRCLDVDGRTMGSASAIPVKVGEGAHCQWTLDYGGSADIAGRVSSVALTLDTSVAALIVYLTGPCAIKSVTLIAADAPQTKALTVLQPAGAAAMSAAAYAGPNAGCLGVFQPGELIRDASGATHGWRCLATEPARLAPEWRPLTFYDIPGWTVASNGNVYGLTRPGLSGLTRGPHGAAEVVDDGSCRWRRLGPVATFTALHSLVAAGGERDRPCLSATDAGYGFLDTSLGAAGRMIWWTGTAWIDAIGALV